MITYPDAVDLVYILDLYGVKDDDTTSLSAEFTANYGPYVYVRQPLPPVGSTVRVVDDEESTYFCEVLSHDSDRRFTVRIDWDSEIPSLNFRWPTP